MKDRDQWKAVAVVTGVATEVGVVALQSEEGRRFAVNRRTPGIRLADLHEGQRVSLLLEGRGIPRVLSASILEAA